MAQHYGIAIIPARPKKPKDKAKVEVGVQIAQRWILACLRNRVFFSMGELGTRRSRNYSNASTRARSKSSTAAVARPSRRSTVPR
jgi:transposase